MEDLSEYFRNKDVLVTGGCGSIGTEIVRALLKYDVKRVRVLDNNESGLFYLQESLGQQKGLRMLLGDIRDPKRLRWAMRGADIVFHAAALKHVPLCENNPFEAVSTNVVGTQNAIEVATDEGVKKFISISTDKAVNPINTMGATKLLSEKLVLNTPFGEQTTTFACVRFGNVFNSVGSVIPVFKNQIQAGGPVTITSRDMIRFFMTIPKAVELVLKASKIMDDREIFILKMNAIRITDLAEVLIEEMAPRYGYEPEDIKIKEIGIRPGEQLYEKLMTAQEAQHVEIQGDMFVLKHRIIAPHYVTKVSDTSRSIDKGLYDARESKVLTRGEIKKLIQDETLF
jgi:FlaA1/EpsC-like NDP-sugar epimerase